jgi:UDP-N-acetylenolpyruvoylglucosamine reductase
VIGGGSNLIVPDAGYDGLVARLCSRGISAQPAGQDVLVTAAAGEPWDEFVAYTIEQGWGGLECLSGIPGLAGATPIQNVGAYGQEVAETITSVEALYPGTLERRSLGPEACGFGYRTSAFKAGALRELIVVTVTFRLRRDAAPVVRYPELQRLVETLPGGSSLPPGAPGLRTVRNAVLQLRRRKSMVIDPSDPHTRSAGSFFTNPVLTPEAYHAATATWKRSGSAEEIPSYPSGEQIKVPAAWLVEHAGFARGYREGNVGISANHVGWYILPFAAGNFLGPLLLGRLFDTLGRRTMIGFTYGVSGLLLALSGYLFSIGALSAQSQTIAWMVIFFFASPAASAAYLTVSETFPLEVRALAIAIFYAIGTGIGGVAGPALFGVLIDTGSRGSVFAGYLFGSVLMMAAAVIGWRYGIAAERRSLEHVARPLAATEDIR